MEVDIFKGFVKRERKAAKSSWAGAFPSVLLGRMLTTLRVA